MKTRTVDELIDLYVEKYPHLVFLANNRNDPRARKDLGNNMAAVAYPKGITGPEALLISEIGME